MSNDTMEDTETICADTVDVTAKYKINSNAPTPPFLILLLTHMVRQIQNQFHIGSFYEDKWGMMDQIPKMQ